MYEQLSTVQHNISDERVRTQIEYKFIVGTLNSSGKIMKSNRA